MKMEEGVGDVLYVDLVIGKTNGKWWMSQIMSIVEHLTIPEYFHVVGQTITCVFLVNGNVSLPLDVTIPTPNPLQRRCPILPRRCLTTLILNPQVSERYT